MTTDLSRRDYFAAAALQGLACAAGLGEFKLDGEEACQTAVRWADTLIAALDGPPISDTKTTWRRPWDSCISQSKKHVWPGKGEPCLNCGAQ